jgi:hypothetical protein
MPQTARNVQVAVEFFDHLDPIWDMTVLICGNCGSPYSTLGEKCLGCAQPVQAQTLMAADITRSPLRLSAKFLFSAVVAITIAASGDAVVRAHRIAAFERAARAEAERLEQERQAKEKRLVMEAAAAVLINNLRPTSLRRVPDIQLRNALAIVREWRTDSTAVGWIRTVERELARR